MRYLNFAILFLMFLSSCVFSGDSKKQHELHNDKEMVASNRAQRGDSITVDTVIGDFKIFYRVSDLIDNDLVSLGGNEEASGDKIGRVPKTILLNIQKKDTTSIVAYKTISVSDFEGVIPNVKDERYVIDTFYLKEVAHNSIIFGAKLCVFDKDVCTDLDIIIDNDGTVKYKMRD